MLDDAFCPVTAMTEPSRQSFLDDLFVAFPEVFRFDGDASEGKTAGHGVVECRLALLCNRLLCLG